MYVINMAVVKIFKNLFCVYLFASYLVFYSECGSCCLCRKKNGIGGGSINSGGNIGSKKYDEKGGPKKVLVKDKSKVDSKAGSKVDLKAGSKVDPLAGSKVDPLAESKKVSVEGKPKPELKKVDPKVETKKEKQDETDKKGIPNGGDEKKKEFKEKYYKIVDGKNDEITKQNSGVTINNGDGYFFIDGGMAVGNAIYGYEGESLSKDNIYKFKITNIMAKSFGKDAKIVTKCVCPDGIEDKFKYNLSVIKGGDIASLRPNESRELEFQFTNIENLPCNSEDGGKEYLGYFYITDGRNMLKGVRSNNHVVGSNAEVVFLVRLKLKKKYNELDEYKDMINEFRQVFDVGKNDFSDDKILAALKNNSFDFVVAFAVLYK